MTYARGTTVAVEKSRYEIERILQRYGASHFCYMSEPTKAMIAFRAKERNIRFDLPLPQPKDFKTDSKLEQALRERWRSLVLCIKAKLESVESHIETFDQAFLAHIVLPDGGTISEYTEPRLKEIYSGQHVPLLPPPTAKVERKRRGEGSQ